MTHRNLQIMVAVVFLAAVAAAGLAISLGFDPLAGLSMSTVSRSVWALAAAATLIQVLLLRWLARYGLEQHGLDASNPASEVFPTRGHFRAATLLYLAFAIYGSLVPLTFQRLNLTAAWERFCHVPYLPLGIASRADWVANILLFIPLAYLAMGALIADVPGKIRCWMAVIFVILCGAALSVTIEFVQLWFPPRTVSVNDIVAETLGTVIGTAFWLLLGDTLTRWLRTYSRAKRSEQIHRLLEFYLAGLVIYSVLPLDLTISPAEMWHKYREGRVVLIPFSELRWSLSGPLQEFAPYLVLTDMATYVPVGMYLIDAWTKPPGRLRSVLHATLLGAALAAAIEVAQLAVFSRTTSTTQIITETLGACIGAAWMRRWYLARRDAPAAAVPPEMARRRARLYFAAAGIYSLPLMIVSCLGGEWLTDQERIWKRFHNFWRAPFSALYWGSEFNATTDVLRKMLYFMPIGALAAAGIWGLKLSPRARWLAIGAALLYAGCVSWAIEMVQVFLPPHIADETDVLLAVAGAAVGMTVTYRALSSAAELPEKTAGEELSPTVTTEPASKQISAEVAAP